MKNFLCCLFLCSLSQASLAVVSCKDIPTHSTFLTKYKKVIPWAVEPENFPIQPRNREFLNKLQGYLGEDLYNLLIRMHVKSFDYYEWSFGLNFLGFAEDKIIVFSGPWDIEKARPGTFIIGSYQVHADYLSGDHFLPPLKLLQLFSSDSVNLFEPSSRYVGYFKFRLTPKDFTLFLNFLFDKKTKSIQETPKVK